VRLSNSKIKTWRRCPKQYDYKYVQGLRPKRKGLALERGTWIHELLQYHYDGEDWKARHKELTDDFYKLFEEEREHLGDLPSECKSIMQGYLFNYRREDSGLIVVDTELDEIITLPNGLEFNFIIDLIVEEPDGLWLWDHKTVKNFMDPDFMLVDAQLARYFWAAEYMGYTPLRGVLFNEIRTKPPTIPPLLQSGGLTRRTNLDTDVRTYYQAIRRAGLDPVDYGEILRRLAKQGDRFYRRTRLPKDKALTAQLMSEMTMTANEIITAERKGHFPRSPDKSCTWGCDYMDLCVTELFGGNPATAIKFNYERVPRHGRQ
jgi:hypothetical protein